MTTTILNSKFSEVEKTIHNHDKYITTPKFKKLTAENFTARLKQANLVTTVSFHKKVTSFNKITSSKLKHLEVQKKLNILITNYYNFFLVRVYFRPSDGSQNTFVYQSTQKETKVLIMFLFGNRREYIILNLSHYILLSFIA